MKLPRTWVFLTHPLGYDPYNSLNSAYLVNTEVRELRKMRTEIVDAFLVNQAARAEVATAGLVEPTPAEPFSPDQPFGDLPL